MTALSDRNQNILSSIVLENKRVTFHFYMKYRLVRKSSLFPQSVIRIFAREEGTS